MSKKSMSLPNETVEYLKAWMMSPEHIAHPYPTDAEKAKIMRDTGIELKQLTNWFVNNRKRYWKPRVEAQLQGNCQTQPAVESVKPRSATQAALKPKLPRSVSLTNTATEAHQHSINEMGDVKSDSFSVPSQGLASSVCNITTNISTSFSDLSQFADSTAETSSTQDHDEQTSIISLPDTGYYPYQNSDDESYNTGQVNSILEKYVKTELIEVHILRPLRLDMQPQLSDVSVLPYLPEDRILRSFKKRQISYSTHVESNDITNEDLTRLIAGRRDSEIMRVKQQCLSDFLNGHDSTTVIDEEPVLSISSPTRKRNINKATVVTITPRKKYRRVSVDLWKKSCNEAFHVYSDEELPTLEEAAQLFGFARAANDLKSV